RLGSVAGQVDPDLGHRADRQGVDARLLGARALDLEALPGHRPEETLGHLAPRRVVRAEEKHPLPGHRLASIPFPTTSRVDLRSLGTSQRTRAVAAVAPISCASTNPGTSVGRIPANVSLAARAIVTAGLANDVEAVNQYAAVMYAATAKGTAGERRRAQPQI